MRDGGLQALDIFLAFKNAESDVINGPSVKLVSQDYITIAQYQQLITLGQLASVYVDPNISGVRQDLALKAGVSFVALIDLLYKAFFPAPVCQKIAAADLIANGQRFIGFTEKFYTEYQKEAASLSSQQKAIASLYAALRKIPEAVHIFVSHHFCSEIAVDLEPEVAEMVVAFARLNQYSGSSFWQQNFQYFVAFVENYNEVLEKYHIGYDFLDLLYDEYQPNGVIGEANAKYISFQVIYDILVCVQYWKDFSQEGYVSLEDIRLLNAWLGAVERNFERLNKVPFKEAGSKLFQQPYLDLFAEITGHSDGLTALPRFPEAAAQVGTRLGFAARLKQGLQNSDIVKELQAQTTETVRRGTRVYNDAAQVKLPSTEKATAQVLRPRLPANVLLETKLRGLIQKKSLVTNWQSSLLDMMLVENADIEGIQQCFIQVIKRIGKQGRAQLFAPGLSLSERSIVVGMTAGCISSIKALTNMQRRIHPEFKLTWQYMEKNKRDGDCQYIRQACAALKDYQDVSIIQQFKADLAEHGASIDDLDEFFELDTESSTAPAP